MRGRTELESPYKGVAVVNDGDCVAIFHSIHRVMQAEKLLKGKKLGIQLIPVPRKLASDCGLAIRFPLNLREAVEKALAEEGLAVVEVWFRQDGNFQQV